MYVPAGHDAHARVVQLVNGHVLCGDGGHDFLLGEEFPLGHLDVEACHDPHSKQAMSGGRSDPIHMSARGPTLITEPDQIWSS